jgi:hypothetical protein
MGIWTLIKFWWYSKQIQTDIDLLWPSIVEHSTNEASARNAFLFHVCNDRAWVALGENEMIHIVSNLPYLPEDK